MAEATYLYSTRDQNATKRDGETITQLGVRDTVAQAFDGIKTKEGASAGVKFDRDKGAYMLVTEGMTTAQEKKLVGALAQFTSPEAEQAWSADRADGLAARETARDAARQVEAASGGSERKRGQMVEQGALEPEAAKSREGAIKVWPALSQKDDYRKLVVQTESDSKYIAKSAEGPYYSLLTSVPDRFAEYATPEAKGRFEQEFAKSREERDAGVGKSADVEVAREAAAKRSDKAFVAQFGNKDKGFLLADPERSADNHTRALTAMRDAPTPDLMRVMRNTQALLDPLNRKEVELRADAAGIPADEMAKKPYAEQRALSTPEGGKAPSLTGDERNRQIALARGLQTLRKELEGRGEGRDVSQDREAGKGAQSAGKAVEAKEPQAERKPRSLGKGVSEEASVDTALDMLESSRRNRGQGR